MSDNPATNLEVEIKVRLANRAEFTDQLRQLGFHLQTPETAERNVLFDTAEGSLRQRKELLRIRRYGNQWLLTHKAESESDPAPAYKARIETETRIEDGEAISTIFRKLGYVPAFIYEKYRTEWTDRRGHIVIDVTPIGDFAELEGVPAWIDETAARLGIQQSQYITTSYGQLFRDWKIATGHPAKDMTFEEIGENKF